MSTVKEHAARPNLTNLSLFHLVVFYLVVKTNALLCSCLADAYSDNTVAIAAWESFSIALFLCLTHAIVK